MNVETARRAENKAVGLNSGTQNSDQSERWRRLGVAIQSQVSTIIDVWASRARQSIDAARQTRRNELRNQLPEWLRLMGQELISRVSSYEAERDEAAKDHGHNRWIHGWELQEVVADYHVLREVVLETLDSSLTPPPTISEVNAVCALIDEAIEEAVEKYDESRQKFRAGEDVNTTLRSDADLMGVGQFDFEWRWMRVNERLAAMLGADSKELSRAPLSQYIKTVDFARQKRHCEELLSGDLQHFEMRLRLLHRDGTERWASVTVSLELSSSEEPLYYEIVVDDSNDKKRLDDEIARAKVVTEEGNRLKSEFVANVSHEIRTPLNAILGMTELALDEALTDELRDYITTAHESARSLLSLVNDLLDFSRIEAGKLLLESTPFDLWATLDETAKALSITASEKGLELLNDISSAVPRYVQGDPLRLRQVMTNLASNAIKFTERGEVVIRAALQFDTDDSATIRFAVIDTGIGISPQDKERIFAPFTQADASTTRVFGGSGLGLAICTELISQMGGTLDVSSELGKGSEFYFTATFNKVEPPHDLAERRRVRTDQLKGRRVLIVDDNATNRSILEKMLGQAGMEVECTDSGDAAIQRLRQAVEANHPFDTVLVDALMPGRDGFSIVEEINQDETLTSMTVLMLSSADRSTFAERTRSLDVDAVLDKPVTRRELIEVLGVTGGRESMSSNGTANASAVPRALRVLVAEDTPANQKLVHAVLTKRGHQVTQASNGREAIDKIYVESFDVVLMDVQMPTLDGYQATRAIREMEEPENASLPIIAMTAHAMKGDAEKCLAVGMDDYISKPIDTNRLIDLIEQWGLSADPTEERRRNNSEKEETVNENIVPTSSEVVVDIDGALSRLDQNRSLLSAMIDYFRDDVPGLVQDIEQGMAQQDFVRVRRAAHSIKGLAGNVGGLQAMTLAAAVEREAAQSNADGLQSTFVELQSGLKKLSHALNEFQA